MNGTLYAALVAAGVSLVVALISAYTSRRQQAHELQRQAEQIRATKENQDRELAAALARQVEQLKTEFRTQFMAEVAINRMLREAEPKRSFEALKKRIGGFDDRELRQLLVRSGALCYWTHDSPPKELWGLMERNEP